MTKQEHITAAEQLLTEAAGISPSQRQNEADRLLQSAQIHATLAVALNVPAPAAPSLTAPKVA
jgi:hypothetical protein